jgi:hypothetical protein
VAYVRPEANRITTRTVEYGAGFRMGTNVPTRAQTRTEFIWQ